MANSNCYYMIKLTHELITSPLYVIDVQGGSLYKNINFTMCNITKYIQIFFNDELYSCYIIFFSSHLLWSPTSYGPPLEATKQ